MHTIEQTRQGHMAMAYRPDHLYYLLDKEHCAEAIESYTKARDAALVARDALTAKYKCTGMILSDSFGDGWLQGKTLARRPLDANTTEQYEDW